VKNITVIITRNVWRDFEFYKCLGAYLSLYLGTTWHSGSDSNRL